MTSKLKNSKEGGASSHLRPCKVAYCDKHNERLDESPTNKNIRPKYSPNNSTWKHPDVPNLVALDSRIRKDYYLHNGRHMPSRGPSKASPLKESVTLMPNGDKATDDIQKRIVDRIEKEFGIRCIRMYNHRDEYCDETGQFNWHGHEVWDMYDHKNHRMVTLTRADCRKWQDIVCEMTGMPRGNPAYETRREWLPANEFKIAKQKEEIQKGKEEIERQQKQIRANEELLAKTEKNLVTRMIAGVKTKIAGNYTPDEVDRMIAKAKMETEERIHVLEEMAKKKIIDANEAANARIQALQTELEKARRTLRDERGKRNEYIREAEERAIRMTESEMKRKAHVFIEQTTADLRTQLARTQSELKDANELMGKRMKAILPAETIAHSFLAILLDDSVQGVQKNNVLALFCDHLDSEGRQTVKKLLAAKGINRVLRTTAELEQARRNAEQKKARDHILRR